MTADARSAARREAAPDTFLSEENGASSGDGRRGRPLVIVLLVLLLFAAVSFLLLNVSREAPSLSERTLPSNLGFFLLININITVLVLLFSLVAKNVVTLVLDRRRNILGAKLRTRLVTAFVALSLVPTVLLFFVAKGILESVMQGWFSPQVKAAVDGARGVATYYYESSERQLLRQGRFLSANVVELLAVLERSRAADTDERRFREIERYLAIRRDELGLTAVSLLAPSRDERAAALSDPVHTGELQLPRVNPGSVARAFRGEEIVRPERLLDGEEFLRAYLPLRLPAAAGLVAAETAATAAGGPEPPRFVLVLTERIAPDLVTLLGSVLDAYDDYQELRAYRRPLASTYLLTLVVVTLLIVFAAMWVGFYLSRGLVVPIGLLAKGTDQIAHGNLDYRIPELGDDELSVLVRSFNTMTRDLKETTGELVARRRYMETVLENVAVGVISFERDFRIATCNLAASAILGVGAQEALLGRQLTDIAPEPFGERVTYLAETLFTGPERIANENVSVVIGERTKHLHVSVTKLFGEQKEARGAVVLVDDVTELVSAQRMAAWREVARRIAHEIKNPLTPIQLCAQRLLRRFRHSADGPASEALTDEKERSLVIESTETIVQQVENLRTLVNEFSRFARMPKATPVPSDLNKVVLDIVKIFREAHPEIRIVVTTGDDLPTLSLDPEQIGRALINLITNSVASVREAYPDPEKGGEERAQGEIIVETSYAEDIGIVTLSVTDNGVGVPERDKEKLFEPYFSTKRGGTGLGLAIVSTIVSDHSGFIRVRDVVPHGATFVIELPVTREAGPAAAGTSRFPGQGTPD